MSNKDKRIRIMEMINPCKVCKLKRTCKRKCIFYLMLMKDSISKSDAIKCMAEAMCRTDDKEENCEYCINYGTKNCEPRLKKYYLDIAEAALNALLKGAKK